MKPIYILLMASCGLFSSSVHAALNVLACEPEWASLVEELAGDKARIKSATTAYQDPHHIEARPSLIASARRADLLVCTGAELETGWLPLLLRQSANASIQPGKPGYFEAASVVERLEIPAEIDRSMGDIHASGNPHVHLDPHRIQIIAEQLTDRLITLDPPSKTHYQSRFRQFKQRWENSITQWQSRARQLKGHRIVTHHRDYIYLLNWLGMELAGTLEPRPGLPTTLSHITELTTTLENNPARVIVHTPYQNNRAAKRLSSLVNAPVLELPYTVSFDEKVPDLFALFDQIINQLLSIQK